LSWVAKTRTASATSITARDKVEMLLAIGEANITVPRNNAPNAVVRSFGRR
jgi:hypothetical protein